MISIMREVNLNGLDLNLLPALDALLTHCNVTRAGVEAGLSQPAMSRALGRLRAVFDDPLLARARGGLTLTPLAMSLRPRLRRALEETRGIFRPPAFDPATLNRTLHIAASDAQTILFAPRLARRVRQEAPGVDLRFHAIGPDILRRLEEGTVDVCFAVATAPLPPGAFSETIARDRLAIVMRRDHPAARRTWTLADYAQWDHVTVAFLGDGLSEIDARLAAAGVRRRIALTTPHFMAAIAAVAATDLVTTISVVFARRFAESFQLALVKPPFDDDGLEVTLVQAQVRVGDPVLQWFRRLVREEADEI
jgi:DNA-binding transcriptional LysR family regulator